MAERIKVVFMLGLLVGPIAPAMADDPADAFQFFQEEAKVVTASRREQSVQDVPQAVDVITPEEIKASGATNLWDLLRFRVGMDVMDGRSIEGNRAVVAVRGFGTEFVSNLQVLLDGRSVYQPVDSGVFWDQLPVQFQDIQRIEIIRGPNSALYGSGAGLGVINIITKKPQAQGPTTASVQTLGGNRETVQSSEALESSIGMMAYRLSTTYQQQDGFPSANGGTSDDFLHTNKANVRTQWALAKGSDLAFSAGRTWSHSGVSAAPYTDSEFDQHFEMLQFSQKLGAHSTMEITSARNDYISDLPSASVAGTDAYSRVLQYDEEILHRLDWWGSRLNTTYGLRYRNVTALSPTILGNSLQREELWDGYFNQSIEITEQWSLSGGASWEGTNVGGTSVGTNYQMASLWKPQENQTFRATYAVSNTLPSLIDTHSDLDISPSVHLSGNSDLTPERLTSYELGYRRSALDKRLQIDSSLYYTTIKNIPGLVTQSVVFSPAFTVEEGLSNVNQAVARGVETGLKYRIDRGFSLYSNYTYEHISDWKGDVGDVTQNTPAHKLNFGGITDLGHGVSGSINVGYKDHYFISSDGRSFSAAVPAYWRLDARLAYAVTPRVELFLAGQNLVASTHLEFADGLVVPRTYQGGMSVTFGAIR